VILPDILDVGLYVVFCGTAAGKASAEAHAYYAHPANRFWPTLHETGLTPILIRPANYQLIKQYRLGLTDLGKLISGPDYGHSSGDYDVTGFREKVRDHAPVIVAFNGKKAAQIALGQPYVDFGLQKQVGIHGAAVWVLPSTSPVANGSWDEVHWFALADAVQSVRRR
jgi:TDG/mug DNA glycosylase family protein